MGKRLQLHTELKELMGSDEVYFQPPETIKMTYPAAVYKTVRPDVKFASNFAYFIRKHYEIEIINRDPDEDYIYKMLARFNYCSFERHFVLNNLHHWVFSLYY